MQRHAGANELSIIRKFGINEAAREAMKEKFMRLTFAFLLVAAMLTTGTADAQNPSTPPAPTVPQQAANVADVPGLGEIMTLQQLRHIKLWFAGHAGNWPLADYEIGELGEGFDDVNKLLGGDTVEKMVGAPMKALQKEVDDKDSAAFAAAFDQLSAGCNSCHHTLDHAFISIKRPTVLPYSDQSFAPQK
jgi:hypothetical protein